MAAVAGTSMPYDELLTHGYRYYKQLPLDVARKITDFSYMPESVIDEKAGKELADIIYEEEEEIDMLNSALERGEISDAQYNEYLQEAKNNTADAIEGLDKDIEKVKNKKETFAKILSKRRGTFGALTTSPRLSSYLTTSPRFTTPLTKGTGRRRRIFPRAKLDMIRGKGRKGLLDMMYESYKKRGTLEGKGIVKDIREFIKNLFKQETEEERERKNIERGRKAVGKVKRELGRSQILRGGMEEGDADDERDGDEEEEEKKESDKRILEKAIREAERLRQKEQQIIEEERRRTLQRRRQEYQDTIDEALRDTDVMLSFRRRFREEHNLSDRSDLPTQEPSPRRMGTLRRGMRQLDKDAEDLRDIKIHFGDYLTNESIRSLLSSRQIRQIEDMISSIDDELYMPSTELDEDDGGRQQRRGTGRYFSEFRKEYAKAVEIILMELGLSKQEAKKKAVQYL